MEQTETIEHRHDNRKSFLKRAQIVVGGGMMDCVVENLSATGARVRLNGPSAVPETFALRFHDGSSHTARRRWSLGTSVGMEFEGAGPAAEAERRHMVEAVREASLAADPAAMLALLHTAWFFGDETLRRAAADLHVAQVRFGTALAPHVGAPEVAGPRRR